MFTGLIQDMGAIQALRRGTGDANFVISTSFDDLQLGESIAVMGACLTVTHCQTSAFTAFASAETLLKTGLSRLRKGDRVNLERALRMGDALGGHWVSGHVDAQIPLLRRTKIGDAERFEFAMPKETALRPQIVSKGSVAIDGVSLTVNQVTEQFFELMVIPISLAHTTPQNTRPGDMVNLETDILDK